MLFRSKVAAGHATESRPTLEKRPNKNAYVQNNYPPESVTSVYFPTRADELAYLNKGLYSEGEISRDISAAEGRSDGVKERQSEGGTERGRERHPSVTPSRGPSLTPEQAKTRAAQLQHMRDMQLTDAQVAEVRRRRTDPARKLVPHAEARERIRRLGS